MRAQFVTSEILIGLRRNLTMTIAVIITTSVSLALVGSAMLMRSQVGLMKSYWYDKIEVSVFLCNHIVQSPNCKGVDVTPAQMEQISADLNNNPAVQKVYFESKEQAWKNFVIQFKNSPGIVKNTNPDALPESYRVKLKDPSKFAVVASAVQDEPGVEQVTDIRKTLDPFFKFLNGLRNGIFVIAIVMFIACALLIFNTIRVAAFSRRRETGIMRLVGASNLYIRLPFLLEGALAGSVGAAFACGFLVLAKVSFVDGVLAPSLTFTPFIGWPEVVGTFPWLFLFGILLSTASSFLAIQRHLRV
ncbi:MAG: cell division transport system permease protein [Frankiales bacterium]|nr:cell division transport system permease protein [Frankiales bacterium]